MNERKRSGESERESGVRPGTGTERKRGRESGIRTETGID